MVFVSLYNSYLTLCISADFCLKWEVQTKLNLCVNPNLGGKTNSIWIIGTISSSFSLLIHISVNVFTLIKNNFRFLNIAKFDFEVTVQ